MQPQSADDAATRVELDQYLRELRRLSSARRGPVPPASHAAKQLGRRGMSRHELRILRRAEGEKLPRQDPAG